MLNFALTYGTSSDDNFVIQACDCRLHYMLVSQKVAEATSTALDNYGIERILLWSVVKFISLYNEVRLNMVVHFGIQLLGLSRIQAESGKNRIHTHAHAY